MLGMALGAVAGGLLGSSGGGSRNQTTTTRIPEWLQNYVAGSDERVGVLPEAESIYNRGAPEYYQGNAVAGLNNDQNNALDMVRMNAGNNPYLGSATDLYNKTMNGDFLGGQEYMRAYGNDVQDRVNSQFASAGRTGSGYHSKTTAEGLGKVTAGLYGQERDRQLQTMGMMPMLNNQRYSDANALMNAGNIQQQQQQQEIGADMARHNYEQNADWQNLDRYANLVYGAPHGNTQTTPMHRNRLAGGLGGALAGMQLASGFGNAFGGSAPTAPFGTGGGMSYAAPYQTPSPW